MRKVLCGFFAVILFSFYFQSAVIAEDFRTDYQVEYTPYQAGSQIETNVKYLIQVTHLRSDIYIKKISLTFPKTFIIDKISAYDKKGVIKPTIDFDDNKMTLGLELNDPDVGRDSVNNIFLEFTQNNLFLSEGNIWEVILPTIDKTERGIYKIVLNLPDSTNRKISIAKPVPDIIRGNQIIWNNAQSKTVYAVFGDTQFYDVKLTYHLDNPRLTPVYIDVAYPPDTMYQKTYVTSLSHAPSSYFSDEDGNNLGRYILKPKEKLDIIYSGIIELSINPRQVTRFAINQLLSDQARYLLTATKYWTLDTKTPLPNLSTPADIYQYLVTNFNYDYSRLQKNSKRMGAALALKNPNNAVCVEFSDAFVALAREKGILSREIQGYGFSQDQIIRPISLVTDVLHSWPEYYDEKHKRWVAVDPTWENTSGIDYFSSLDLNHITFVIHGKNPEYPLSAGMYKTEASKDIVIKPIIEKPVEKIQLDIKNLEMSTIITDDKPYGGVFTLTNTSNIYLWDLNVDLSGQNLDIKPQHITISNIAPGQTKKITFAYQSPERKPVKQKSTFIIKALNHEILKQELTIIPYYYGIAVKFIAVCFVIFVLFFLIKLLRRRQR